jgi:hypothetical protein
MKSKNALLVAGFLALSPLPSSAADGEPFFMMAPFKSITVPGFNNKISFPLPSAGITFYCPNDGTPATAKVA